MGVVTNEGFTSVIQDYQDQIAEIEGKHLDAERVKESWDELKRKGKG
jgi:hypothetical protein